MRELNLGHGETYSQLHFCNLSGSLLNLIQSPTSVPAQAEQKLEPVPL